MPSYWKEKSLELVCDNFRAPFNKYPLSATPSPNYLHELLGYCLQHSYVVGKLFNILILSTLFQVPVKLLWPFPLFCHPISQDAPIGTVSFTRSVLPHCFFSSSNIRSQDVLAMSSMADQFLVLWLLMCPHEQEGCLKRIIEHLHVLLPFLHVTFLWM